MTMATSLSNLQEKIPLPPLRKLDCSYEFIMSLFVCFVLRPFQEEMSYFSTYDIPELLFSKMKQMIREESNWIRRLSLTGNGRLAD